MKLKSIALIAWIALMTASLPTAQPGDRSGITTRHMPAPADRVLRAFFDESDLEGWWKTTRSLVDPETGGIWAITWEDRGAEKTHHAWSGVIRELSANRLCIGSMVMTEPGMPLLGPMTLEIFVEPAGGGGTNVTVTHSGYGYGNRWDEIHALVVDGWDHVLGDMAAWFGESY